MDTIISLVRHGKTEWNIYYKNYAFLKFLHFIPPFIYATVCILIFIIFYINLKIPLTVLEEYVIAV